jgi:hypothetical protein
VDGHVLAVSLVSVSDLSARIYCINESGMICLLQGNVALRNSLLDGYCIFPSTQACKGVFAANNLYLCGKHMS